MLEIGKTDSFEQNYMAKFEQLATSHGVFVKYERDRAGRDLGLHLTKNTKSGARQVTNSLVWFQMKGIMASTLSKQQFEAAGSISIQLDVEHLRHWFLDETPTHLVVYVESIDAFLVQNLRTYVEETWGKAILTLAQKTATVRVNKNSVLDDQAFSLLLAKADLTQWMKALGIGLDAAKTIRSFYSVIYSAGTAKDRGMTLGVFWRDWISKTRDEVKVVERPADFDGAVDEDWKVLQEHWQYRGIDIEASYDFFELFALEPVDEDAWGDEEEYDDDKTIELKNGDKVFSQNYANEFYECVIGARLNEYGHELFGHVKSLVDMGLIELREPDDEGHLFMSIAPFHARDV